jgi:peptidoglycan/xylan/chitin deacetylase (PgdA/CDA1 family)
VICFTYDDAYNDAYQAAAIHDAYGQKITVAMTSNAIGSTNVVNGRAYLTSPQILNLYNRGHEIANHTATHPHLGSLSASQRVTEYDTCQSVLAGITGVAPTTFVVPYGTSTDFTAAIQQEMWGRFSLVAATLPVSVDGGGTYPWSCDNRFGQFAIYRYGVDNWGTAGPILIDAINRAAREPIIVSAFAHTIGSDVNSGPTWDQWTAVIQLAHSLGIPCVTLAKALGGGYSVIDPGFELGTLTSNNWLPSLSGTGAATSVVDTPDTGMPGTRSLALQVTTPGDFAYVHQTWPVKPSTTYTLSGRYRTTAGAGASAKATWAALGWNGVSAGAGGQTSLAEATSWTRFTADHITGPETYMLTMRLTNLGAAAGTVYFDHIHMGEKRFGTFG